jgi:hypothetical protein
MMASSSKGTRVSFAWLVSLNQFLASFFGFGQSDNVQQLTVKAFVKAVTVVGERKF